LQKKIKKKEKNKKKSLSISNSFSFIQKKTYVPKIKKKEFNNSNNTNFKSHNHLTLKSDSSIKKLLSPIKRIKNNYLMQRIKEYRNKKIFHSTLMINSLEEEKEKKIIDKIYQKAFNNNFDNKTLKINFHQIPIHNRINSDIEKIDKVDFLLMDKTIRNFIPNKNKILIKKPRRIPLNYKSHSPILPITQKIKK